MDIVNKKSEMQTLADRINSHVNQKITMSGRGHGRTTPHGRGPSTKAKRAKKQDMLYFVRDAVRKWRQTNASLDHLEHPQGLEHDFSSTYGWANYLARDVQFFDCSMISEYVTENVEHMYPDNHVPPHPDVILPAESVGLYFSEYPANVEAGNILTQELMFICVPLQQMSDDPLYERRIFTVYSYYDNMIAPMPIGNIVNTTHGDCMFEELAANFGASERDREALIFHVRVVAAALQTINQPRYVISSKRHVSLVKRQSFRKATGRFTPDSWNLVSWNVDKPVKAKPYEEGGGARQALHFRRGHWRKAKEEWDNVRWSEDRGRWEKYIHGYEAGNPAFGVKKSYHMPRKEAL